MYKDRIEAGKLLANELNKYKKEYPIVLGLPRGGVVVAYEVAKILNAPLDLVIVRKIGAPDNPEFAIGAIAEGHEILLDNQTIDLLRVSPEAIKESITNEEKELERRHHLYRGRRPLSKIKNRMVILVDDGLATGLTGLAAVKAVKKLQPKKIIFALPVCAADSQTSVVDQVDSLVCMLTPDYLSSIGAYYEDFRQISDEEVVDLLHKSALHLHTTK